MNPIHRRELLGLGALGTAIAVGGCLGESESSRPYTDWIPRREGGQLVAYVDFGVASESEPAQQLFPMILPSDADGSEPSYAPQFRNLEDVDDPLLTLPLAVGGSLIGLSALSLSVSGLDYLLDPVPVTGSVQELLFADGTVVATGDIDVSTADSSLRSETRGFSAPISHERTGEHAEFALYETTSAQNESFVAVDESAVVIADDRDHVTAAIDARRGERSRATDADPFEWLLETAGNSHFVLGWDSPVSLDRHLFGTSYERIPDVIDSGRQDVCSSLRFEPGADTITAQFAVNADQLDPSTREQLTAQFGTDDPDVATSRTADRLSLTRTYTQDATEFTFVERGDGTNADDQPEFDRDPPPAVANAVPDDAFSFSYDGDERMVRVTFEQEVTADEITITATESENEVTMDSPDNVRFMSVVLAPEDTEVVVIATVDGASGVVASESLPDRDDA